MKRILYISAASGVVDKAEIADILNASRRNNANAEVTGMLLHIDGGFLQVLEGPEAAVDATYARISGDPRHNNVILLWSEEADNRAFGQWRMGFDRMPENDPRWSGAFRVDPRDPDEALEHGVGPEIVDLMRSFYQTSLVRRFA